MSDTGILLWIVIIALLALSAFGFVRISINKQNKEGIREKIQNDNFKPDEVLVKVPNGGSIPVGAALDRTNNKLCLIIGESYRYLDGQDLIESEVLIDGKTVTKTSRASQFAGAAIGGVLFGGIGAAVGALSGKTTTGIEAKGVKLQLTINDLEAPFHIIDFIEMTAGGSTSPSVAVQEAEQWHTLFSTIIKINEKATSEEPEHSGLEGESESFSDEIRSLHELLQQGALTEEEYNAAKQRVIEKWNKVPG